MAPEYVARFWEPCFPNELARRFVVADELESNVIELEGERLMVIPLGSPTARAQRACTYLDLN